MADPEDAERRDDDSRAGAGGDRSGDSTIDVLLRELIPTAELPSVPAAEPLTDGPQPELGTAPEGVRRPGRRRRRTVTAIGGVALLAVGVLGGLAVGRGLSDRPPASTATTAALASERAPDSGSAGPVPTTAVATTVGPSPDKAELVVSYRATLTALGFDSTKLTDDELAMFGSAACVFAASAETPNDLNRFRSAAVAAAPSSLTADEETVVINTALNVFCPQEARRLGLST